MPRASSHLWAVAKFDATPDKDGKYEAKLRTAPTKALAIPQTQHVKRVHGLNTPEKKRQPLEEFTAIAPLTWDTCAAAFAIRVELQLGLPPRLAAGPH
jgi:hypothetical protein